MIPYVLIRGGGDLASGVAIRLHHAGIWCLVVEIDQPLVVRRSVAFAEAVYAGKVQIEDVTGKLITDPGEAVSVWDAGEVPVIVDPDLLLMKDHPPLVLVDARMRKKYTPVDLETFPLVVGLGPGFTAGENCHAAVETNRGHFLGRVYWEGDTQKDTGVPGVVQSYGKERVLYAPVDGVVDTLVAIGDIVKRGDAILSVNDEIIRAPFPGVVRGLIHRGIDVQKGMKVGDVDPRLETFRCWLISEKSLAIGGGVLEAVLAVKEIRSKLWKG